MPISKKFIAREILIILTVVICFSLYLVVIYFMEKRYVNLLQNAGVAESVFLEEEINDFQTMKNKIRKGWEYFFLVFGVVMITRYTFYVIKWSIRTLKS